MRRTAMPNRRGGFTLVELIVVIGIIVLIAGLVISAVLKVREAGPRTQTRADIGDLSSAVEQFKSTYDVKYIPSGLVLIGNPPPASPSPALVAAAMESRTFLSKAWPKGLNSFTIPQGVDQIDGEQISVFFLDGNQTLVFLLGGIPPGPDGSKGELFTNNAPLPPGQIQYPFPPYFQGTRTGFRDSPTNPMNAPPAVGNPYSTGGMTGERMKGPFFDFKDKRLRGGTYLDPYGTPYLYFSSKNGNDYHAFGVYANVIPGYTTNDGGWGQVSPFRGLDGKYLNPQGFQIISAGKDQLFGRGSYLDPTTNKPVLFEPGVGDYSPGAQGGDDISNFHIGPLGGD